MLVSGLKHMLSGFGLRQTEFAKLLDVSPRAVSMWAVGDVDVPGPVEGYLRLLKLLSPGQRASEFMRLPGREKMLAEGMYRFRYCTHVLGEEDSNQALCVLQNGKIFGSDPWDGVFRGSYMFNPAHETTNVQVELRVPPNAMMITGVSAGKNGRVFEINGSFDRAAPVSKSVVKVDGALVEVVLEFLGPLPE